MHLNIQVLKKKKDIGNIDYIKKTELDKRTTLFSLSKKKFKILNISLGLNFKILNNIITHKKINAFNLTQV